MFMPEDCDVCGKALDVMTTPPELRLLRAQHSRCCIPCLRAIKAATEQRDHLRASRSESP